MPIWFTSRLHRQGLREGTCCLYSCRWILPYYDSCSGISRALGSEFWRLFQPSDRSNKQAGLAWMSDGEGSTYSLRSGRALPASYPPGSW